MRKINRINIGDQFGSLNSLYWNERTTFWNYQNEFAWVLELSSNTYCNLTNKVHIYRQIMTKDPSIMPKSYHL